MKQRLLAIIDDASMSKQDKLDALRLYIEKEEIFEPWTVIQYEVGQDKILKKALCLNDKESK